MNFAHFINENQAFTTQQMLSALRDAPSARVALSRAVKSGRVQKVRKGLYVSQSGRFIGVKAGPHHVVSTLCPDAVFVYHSALELHGLAHSAWRRVQFESSKGQASFDFDGVEYRGRSTRAAISVETLSAKAYGSVAVTTREQTLVDCLGQVALAGGSEEVLRSLSGLLYLDIDAVLACVGTMAVSVSARVGWYLSTNKERLSVPDYALATLAERVPANASYKFDPTLKRFESYDSKWRLNLPASAVSLREWMEM